MSYYRTSNPAYSSYVWKGSASKTRMTL